MKKKYPLDKIAINVKSHKLLKNLLKENPKLEEIMRHARNETEALIGVRNWVYDSIQERPQALKFYQGDISGRKAYQSLKWSDLAAIRILDYIDNAGREFPDLNLRGEIAVSNPIELIWLAVTFGTGGAKPYFFEDMLHLFRQFTGQSKPKTPGKTDLLKWMNRYPSGLDPRIIKLREENRARIIKTFIKKMDEGIIKDAKFKFEPKMSYEQKFLKMLEWWTDHSFHLHFAIRNADILNEMLGESLDPDTMKILYDAEKKKIPFFVNPYYLSLLHVRVPYFAIGADLAIRYYVLYSRQLVDEFNHIVAWEKEDIVKPGEPNVAGWLLPEGLNIHRRYPEVAILIPDTMGRSCAGLCSTCQRMYSFQSGNLNFDLDKLKPTDKWPDRLNKLMKYFESDSQLRDILITGGDAFMCSDHSLKNILDAVYEMTVRKKEINKKKDRGKKYAEIQRVRLGTRLPIYLPQRINTEFTKILAEFKQKAEKIGIQQFIIQTHVESPMEITPEARQAFQRLTSAGWLVTNQLVFTTAASRRGHTAKLRKVLNDVGVLPYYTFTVKGYMENYFSYVPNARAVQEQLEEKLFGEIPKKFLAKINDLHNNTPLIQEHINDLLKSTNNPFLATDRNVLNLPGVGKSLTFRVIGITRYGRRILEFDHDASRNHSPIIGKMGKIVIIESKSISEYLRQLEEIGEDTGEYEGLFGYSIGDTEPRLPIYEYPPFNFKTTNLLTNFKIQN